VRKYEYEAEMMDIAKLTILPHQVDKVDNTVDVTIKKQIPT
jgi:hypothetical protein